MSSFELPALVPPREYWAEIAGGVSMYIARLLILAFWMGFSVPCFSIAQLASNPGKVAGNAAQPVKPKTIVGARSLAILVHNN